MQGGEDVVKGESLRGGGWTEGETAKKGPVKRGILEVGPEKGRPLRKNTNGGPVKGVGASTRRGR